MSVPDCTPSTLPAPRSEILEVPEYSRARAAGVPVRVRASSNESPFPPSAKVREAVIARLATANWYPTPGAEDLNAALEGHLGVDPGAVASADGSLSLLTYLLLTFVHPGQDVVYAWRSYEAYAICTRTASARPREVPLRPDGTHDLTAMLQAIGPMTAAVIVCNPNNPTGTRVNHGELEAFVDQVPPHVLVVLDEAYRDFDTKPGAVDGLAIVAQHRNVVSLRTFSKAYGLAGLRVGYAVAAPEVLGLVRRILPPFPVNALGIAAALASLDDPPTRERIVAAVVEGRTRLEAAAEELGIQFFHSAANFVWFPHAPEDLEQRCAEQGMTVRAFRGEGTRVSVGDPRVTELFVRALQSR